MTRQVKAIFRNTFCTVHSLNPPKFERLSELSLEYFHVCIAEPENDTEIHQEAKLSHG